MTVEDTLEGYTKELERLIKHARGLQDQVRGDWQPSFQRCATEAIMVEGCVFKTAYSVEVSGVGTVGHVFRIIRPHPRRGWAFRVPKLDLNGLRYGTRAEAARALGIARTRNLNDLVDQYTRARQLLEVRSRGGDAADLTRRLVGADQSLRESVEKVRRILDDETDPDKRVVAMGLVGLRVLELYLLGDDK